MNYREASPEKEKEIKPAAADAMEGEEKDTNAVATDFVAFSAAPAAPVALRPSLSPAKKQREASPEERAAATTIDKKEDVAKSSSSPRPPCREPKKTSPISPRPAPPSLPPPLLRSITGPSPPLAPSGNGRQSKPSSFLIPVTPSLSPSSRGNARRSWERWRPLVER